MVKRGRKEEGSEREKLERGKMRGRVKELRQKKNINELHKAMIILFNKAFVG